MARKPVKKPAKPTRAQAPRKPAPKRKAGAAGKKANPARRAPVRVVKKAAAKAAPPREKQPRKAAPKAATRPAVPEPEPERRLPLVPPRPMIRLAGSASSRLTIKPGPPQGLRTQLELSTRPRPSGPRKLSEVDLEEDEVLIDGFEAVLEGEKVKVTAVLERTCVYVDRGGDRRLARKVDLWVEADKLPIRRRGLT